VARERCPERWRALARAVDEADLEEAERVLGLAVLDRVWADQLAVIADVREGAHLHSLQNTNPFLLGWGPLAEFNKQITGSFQSLLAEVDDRVVEAFDRLEVGEDGLDLAAAGIRGPGATWTYLVNDDPFENALVRVMRRVRDTLRRD